MSQVDCVHQPLLPPAMQTHVTTRLQQHAARPIVALPSVPSTGSARASRILRSTTLTLRSTTALARSKTSALEPDDTSAGVQGLGEPLRLEEVEEGEGAVVTTLEWETVKDPPLNLRVAASALSSMEATFLAAAVAGGVAKEDARRGRK